MYLTYNPDTVWQARQHKIFYCNHLSDFEDYLNDEHIIVALTAFKECKLRMLLSKTDEPKCNELLQKFYDKYTSMQKPLTKSCTIAEFVYELAHIIDEYVKHTPNFVADKFEQYLLTETHCLPELAFVIDVEHLPQDTQSELLCKQADLPKSNRPQIEYLRQIFAMRSLGKLKYVIRNYPIVVAQFAPETDLQVLVNHYMPIIKHKNAPKQALMALKLVALRACCLDTLAYCDNEQVRLICAKQTGQSVEQSANLALSKHFCKETQNLMSNTLLECQAID